MDHGKIIKLKHHVSQKIKIFFDVSRKWNNAGGTHIRTKCMLTWKDSDYNCSNLTYQVTYLKWKLPPLYLRWIRQWFNKHVGGRGTWRVCTPHPTLTSTFLVSNHFTYWVFLCCVDRWQVLKGGLWLDCHGDHLVAQNTTAIFRLHNNTSHLILFRKCVNHI